MSSQDNPYDENNVRTDGFRCRARIEPKHDDPDTMALTLSVSDGPEAYSHFDPKTDLDLYGENALTAAITDGVNKMLGAALENEAGRLIEDHKKVYVVQGHTGKLADGSTGAVRWPVKAFLSEERAHDLMRTLNHWCCQNGVARVCYEDPMKRLIIDPEGTVAKCPQDPGFRVDETGVLYLIVEVPLDMFDPTSG